MPLSSITFVTLFGAPYQRVTREIRRCCGGCEHNKLYWEHDISGMGWNYSVAKSPERSGGHASSTSSYNLFDSGTFFWDKKASRMLAWQVQRHRRLVHLECNWILMSEHIGKDAHVVFMRRREVMLGLRR